MNKISIYVHIPFCNSKCYYCNFVSGCYNKQIQEKYFNALKKEIQSLSPNFNNYKVKTIYFGGGTPSSVDEKYICDILNTIKSNYSVLKNAEISIECNPCSTTIQKLTSYRNAGFNRISFGVQSLDNDTLKTIGRRHDRSQALSTIESAKLAGFENINADLLIGLPNQKQQQLLDDAKVLIESGVKHLSCYMLINEKNTPIYKMVKQKIINLPTDDYCVDLYNDLVKFLKSNKFDRYEISNFSLPKFECKHNQNYWNLGEYIGFGVAAHSYYNKQRIANCENIEKYILKNNKKIEKLNNNQLIEEYIMLGLRTKQGISNNFLINYFNYDLINIKNKEINFLKNNKLIKINKNIIKVATKNYGVTNQIILKLI